MLWLCGSIPPLSSHTADQCLRTWDSEVTWRVLCDVSSEVVMEMDASCEMILQARSFQAL